MSVNTGKIAAVSTGDAVALAQQLQAAGKTAGFSGYYQYLAQDFDNGVRYIFLDCTRSLNAVRSFLARSLLVSFCAILAVFLLVLVLSRRAVRPVAESYEKQKQFITNASHEIKTPLSIIDSCAEVLELEQGENKWTQGIRSQIVRLTGLTQNLMSLARMDEGSTALMMEDFDFSEAAAQTLAVFELMAENNGLKLTCTITPDIHIHGNEQALCQLCSILADNAVKYALPRSEIRISLRRKGKKITLSSENAADNLRRGDLPQLFDRFYRGDASRSSEKSGYGIGLSMAQAIVTAHGGKIAADSADGQTLKITVQL
ncbi:MAG: HAMP domain-containing sensor histidine kinase [Oscillospiraceae bacterium]|nr:HAMP domain-containing sensor histidine kinase [Oscillospiraceae bacterium]